MFNSDEINTNDKNLWEKIKPALGKTDKASCPKDEFFASYLEAKLSNKEASLFEEHLFNCPECRKVLGELRVLIKEKPLEVPFVLLKKAKSLMESPSKKEYMTIFRLPKFYPAYPGAGFARLALTAVLILVTCVAGGIYGKQTGVNSREIVINLSSDMSFGISDYSGDYGGFLDIRRS